MAFPDGWAHKLAITISAAQLIADLTDWTFVLDQAFDAVLTQVDGPLDADGSRPILADGGDIRFSYDADGLTELPVDPRSIALDNDPSLGLLEIATKLPLVSSSADTTIHLWWGNALATKPLTTDTYGQYNAYDGNEVLVLSDGGTNSRTRHPHSITSIGTIVSGGIDGAVGKGTDYNGTDAYISIADNDDLSFSEGQEFTISVMANIRDTGTYGFVGKQVSDTDGEYSLRGFAKAVIYISSIDSVLFGAQQRLEFSFTTNPTWDSFTYIKPPEPSSSGDQQLYINGIREFATNNALGTYELMRNTAHPVLIGKHMTNLFDGIIDSVTMANIQRSESWQLTTEKNKTNVAGFITFGEITDFLPPVFEKITKWTVIAKKRDYKLCA